MQLLRLLFIVIGVSLSLWLVGILLFGTPYDEFSEQGSLLMDMIWGQISLLDLYSGFFLVIALVWFIEPKAWVRWAVTITMPLLGNPILAIWVVARIGVLRQLASKR